MVADCAAWSADVVVVDSTGELLPMFGANSDNADDFTKVHNRVLQPLAKTGAAVLLVDHLAKGRNSRQLGQGGSIAKRRTVGGLSLRVVRERPFTRNGGGSALLWVNKDRHGGVRQYCAVVRPASKDRDELAGRNVRPRCHRTRRGQVASDTGTGERQSLWADVQVPAHQSDGTGQPLHRGAPWQVHP
jgi:hypothetical protein